MTTPAIRLYCLALPSDGVQHGLDYLVAFDQTGLGVKALPIGPAYLMVGSWPKVMHLFMAPLPGDHYVNVVIAPPGLSLGFAHKASAVAPGAGAIDGPIAIPGMKSLISSEVAYEPQTALGGLFTLGVPNIAITTTRPKPPDANEVRALQQYNFVLSPTDEEAKALRVIGVDAFHVPPDPGQLGRLLSSLLI